MIRVLIFLALVALFAFGVTWIADRPGDVAITWQGYRIETSVMVAAAAVVVVAALTVVVWAIVRTILRSPDHIKTYLNNRRGVRGYLAISRGLIAVGAGDAGMARRAAADAQRIAPGAPLTLLLNAQCAQLAGDRDAAEQAFREMTAHDDTKLLGLRGLYIEAQRRKDVAVARGFAEAAANAAPGLGWAGQAVLDFRCAEGDWAAALAALDRNSRYKLIGKDEYKRQRAVLLTARALAAEDGDRDRARSLALDAVKLAPSLVPAAELAGRLLGDAGETRRAARIVEKAWTANPHPDLADTYAHLKPGDSARQRLARVQSLAAKAAGHAEGALAVAHAALEAQEFAAARKAIAPLLREPTQRVAVLMADIEQRESGDEGRAREWMARAVRAARDPAWTADGVVSERWMPVSPVSGRLDAFQWKVPLAQIGDQRETIDSGLAANEQVPAKVTARPAELPGGAGMEPKPPVAPTSPPQAKLDRKSEPRPESKPEVKPEPKPEPVIPLLHVPDDPGPDAAPDLDPAPGPASGPGVRLYK